MITPTIYNLGFFPGGVSAQSYGVANDGIVIGLGNHPSAGSQGFRATIETGLISIGSLFSPTTGNSVAYATAPDASKLVGASSKPTAQFSTCPVTYDDLNGLQELLVSFGYGNASCRAISPDKSTYGGSADNTPVAWFNIPPYNGGSINYYGQALSLLATFQFGEVLGVSNYVTDLGTRYRGFAAGYCSKIVGPTQFWSACFWTPTSASAVLLNPFGADTNAKAMAIRYDGTLIAGNSWTTDSTRTRGVLWGAATNDIGVMAGYDYTTILGMSPNGIYVVGYCLNITTGFKRAFVWDFINGFTDLGVYSGETSSSATGVTDDGRFVSGYGNSRALLWIISGRPKLYAKITISKPQPINIPCYTERLATGGIITKV